MNLIALQKLFLIKTLKKNSIPVNEKVDFDSWYWEVDIEPWWLFRR